MKLYATVQSERAAKGQGGNKYLDIPIFINERDTPKYRVRVLNNAEAGQVYVSIEAYFFGKWRVKWDDMLYENVTEKGEKQKGE